MNLLDRLWRLIPVLVIGVLVGCEEANEIGEVLNPGENKIKVLYKELDLTGSNVFIDSLRTDIDKRVLVGNFNDPIFGHTIATGYSEFNFSSSSFEPRENSSNEFIIDSAFVNLVVSYYHSSDSAQSHSFELHTLTDTLLENVYYLSDFQTPYNSEIVSKENSNVFSNELDTIRINLTELFSKQLLEHVDESIITRYTLDSLDGVIDTTFNFSIDQIALKDYFKGFAIVAGSSNNSTFGFELANLNSTLDIYFKIEKETEDQSSNSFITLASTSGTKYYNLSTNRLSSSLTIIDKENTLIDSVSTSDDKLYLQPGTSIFPKISLASYLSFIDSLDNIIINRVDIELSLSNNNETFKYLAKPTDIRYFLYSGGRNINVTGLLNNSIDNTLIHSNLAYLNLQPNPLSSFYNETENYYSGDITLFSQLIESGDIQTESLLIIPSDVNSMNHVIFNGATVKMKIFYTLSK